MQELGRWRGAVGALVGLGVALGASGAGAQEEDPLFAGDARDPGTGEVVELLPGVAWLRPGPDGKLGTGDDELVPGVVGDVDLVVRAGLGELGESIPAPAPDRGSVFVGQAGPFGTGEAIAFVVGVSDGSTPPAWGQRIVSPALEGAPVLVMAFGDLDGDGWIGVTERDGDAGDTEREEAELDPVGRRFARFAGGEARGVLHVGVGGPAGARLRVVLAAAAYAGPSDAGFFGGVVPVGPAVLTALPFWPRTDPERVVQGELPAPADPDALVGVEIASEFTPKPSVGVYGEAFTRATDGSEASVDVAWVASGAWTGFGVARPAAPDAAPAAGALRPGLDAAGARLVWELRNGLALTESAGVRALWVVPVDGLGNVADLPEPMQVEARATGGLVLVSPDTDGDPARERFEVADARGRRIEVSGLGGVVLELVPEAGVLGLLGLLAGLAVLARRRGVA